MHVAWDSVWNLHSAAYVCTPSKERMLCQTRYTSLWCLSAYCAAVHRHDAETLSGKTSSEWRKSPVVATISSVIIANETARKMSRSFSGIFRTQIYAERKTRANTFYSPLFLQVTWEVNANCANWKKKKLKISRVTAWNNGGGLEFYSRWGKTKKCRFQVSALVRAVLPFALHNQRTYISPARKEFY